MLHSTNFEIYSVVHDVSSVLFLTVVSASLCVCITDCLTVTVSLCFSGVVNLLFCSPLLSDFIGTVGKLYAIIQFGFSYYL